MSFSVRTALILWCAVFLSFLDVETGDVSFLLTIQKFALPIQIIDMLSNRQPNTETLILVVCPCSPNWKRVS